MHKAVLECAASHSRKLFYHCSFERKGKISPDGYVERNKALVNLSQEEPRALRAMVQWLSLSRDELYDCLKDTVFSQKRVVPTHLFPRFGSDDITERLRAVQRGIEEEEMDIYYFAATPADQPVQVVKAIVPGIEMELGSYHRIGRRGVQRLMAREDALISHSDGSGKKRIMLTKADENLVGGPVWLNTKQLDALVNPVYPLYREATGHSAAYAYETDYYENDPVPLI